MMKLVFWTCILQLARGVDITSYLSGFQNEYDEDLLVSPGSRFVFTGIASEHHNGYDDRKYKFYFGNAPDMECPTNDLWSTFINQFDEAVDFDCPRENEAISGIESYHNDATEDRRWNFRCCNIESNGKYAIGAIRTTGWINNFDGPMDSKCGSTEVMVGAVSVHDNGYQDRKWKLKCGSVIDGWAVATEGHKQWVSAQLLPPASTALVNDWDAELEFETPRNYVISGMRSERSGPHGDRKFGFSYTTGRVLTCEPGNWSSLPSYWWWYGVIDIQCGADEALSGLKSTHDNKREDRRWSWKCCKLEGHKYKIGNTYQTEWINDWGASFDHACGGSEVLVGLYSHYDTTGNSKDRRWKVQCGKVEEQQAVTRVLNEGKACKNNGQCTQGDCDWCGIGLCCQKGVTDATGDCDGSFGGINEHQCVPEPASRKISFQKPQHQAGQTKTVYLGKPYSISRVRVTGGTVGSEVRVDSTLCGKIQSSSETDLDCILAGRNVQAEGGSNLNIEVFGSSIPSSPGGCEFEDPTISGGKVTAPRTYSSASECVNWCYTFSRYRTGCEHKTNGVCVLYTAAILGTSSDTTKTCWNFIDTDTFIAHVSNDLQPHLNVWDGPLEFTAQDGRVLSGIQGDHNNHYEDREYGLYTASVGGIWEKAVQKATPQGWQANWSAFKEDYAFQCPPLQAMVGMSSRHNDDYEDREWKARCGKFDERIKLVEQRWTGWLNEHDKPLNAHCGGYEVMVGAESTFQEGIDDRRWKIACAKVSDRFPGFDPVLLHRQEECTYTVSVTAASYSGPWSFEYTSACSGVSFKAVEKNEQDLSIAHSNCGTRFNLKQGLLQVVDNGQTIDWQLLTCANQQFSVSYTRDLPFAISRSNWMGALQDERSLAELSIPGTHDSGSSEFETLFVKEYVKTQDHDFETQLTMGIRIFDIRVTHNKDRFHLVHGDVKMEKDGGDWDLEDAFVTPAKDFLKANPSECIIAQFQQQKDPEENTRDFADTWQMYLDMESSMWLFMNSVPTLGQCRGKVWVITRSGNIKFTQAVPSGRVFVEQNEWEVTDEKLTEHAASQGRRRRDGEKRRLDTSTGVSTDILEDGEVVHLNDMAKDALGRAFLNYKMKDAILDMEQDGVVISTGRESELTAEGVAEIQKWAEEYFGSPASHLGVHCRKSDGTQFVNQCVLDKFAADPKSNICGPCGCSGCPLITESVPEICRATFVDNVGNRTPDVQALKIDANTFVFGHPSDWLKMVSVNAQGQKIESRYAGPQNNPPSQVTQAEWEGANRGGNYNVEDVEFCASGRRREEADELAAPSASGELVPPSNGNLPARRRIVFFLLGAVVVTAVIAAASTAAVFSVNARLDTRDIGDSMDITEIDTSTGLGYKIWSILDHHTTKVENNFSTDKMSMQFFSFSDSTCWTAWPCTIDQTSREIRQYRTLVPNLRGNQLGGILFDFPEQWQLDQVLCRNWGLLDGTFENGKCV